ncbi:MAG: DUF6502 family protein [Steroidobacteraceae bacterium]
MTTSIPEIEVSAASLIEKIVRILAACGVDSSIVVDLIANSLERNAGIQRPRPITTSDGAHLRACQVVFRWRRDPRFLGRDGLPANLNRVPHQPSFDGLVSVVLPGEDPDRVLDYLLAFEAVEVRDEQVRLLVDSVLTSTGRRGDTLAPGAVLSHVNNFLTSVEFNLLEKPNISKGRFERACYVSIPDNLVPVFERFIDRRGQDFIDVVDEWLERHRAGVVAAGPRTTVGAGAYMFVHPSGVPVP